jgi:4-hydroxybenzoate polyprenyltransferase
MAAHTALGYFLAVGLSGAIGGEALKPALAGLALWVVCLNGGTLALNSAFDRDEGDIGYLRSPPPAPRHLAIFALLLMAVGQGLSLLLPRSYTLAYATCFALSVVYSMPPFRFKAMAGVDWLINMWGFGTITPYAGYVATDRAPGLVHGLVLLAFCPLFAALYPLTQLYQLEEDRRRGDRTFALLLGMERSLLVALGAAIVAFLWFATAGILADWGVQPRGLVRWVLLALAAAGWGAVLIRWLWRYPRMSPAEHQRAMYYALGAWAITDLAVLLSFGS